MAAVPGATNFGAGFGGGGIGVGGALLGSSLLGGVTSLIGGGKGASAAEQAAQDQAQAAEQATAVQEAEFQQVQQLLTPFVNYGTQALPQISQLTGTAPGTNALTAPLTSPLQTSWPTFQPTMAQLEQTPGYQFTLGQGLLTTQSGYAAQGLGRSGSAMAGAEQYATGLASTTYNQQFNNYLAQVQQQMGQTSLALSQRAQIYNMLTGQAQTGLQAAGALGGVGTQTAQAVGQNIQTAGAAQAAGAVGAAQAQVSGMTGASNSLSNAALMYAMNQAGLFGNTGAS